MKFASLFGALVLVVSTVQAAFDPATLKNTLLPGTSDVVVRDPTIMYNPDSKKYFIFATGKASTGPGTERGFKIMTSPKLQGPWKEVGSVLPNGPNFNVSGGVSGYWAPDVAKIDDTYVVTYTICEKGILNYYLGLATSKTMEPGSWTDHGLIHQSFSAKPAGFFAIDSNLLQVNNTVWLTYGSFIDGIFQLRLDKQTWKKLDEGRGSHAVGKNNRPVEGGILFKPLVNDWYYLFFSVGKTMLEGMTQPTPMNNTYHVRVGRSKNPNGPFVGGLGNELTTNLPIGTGNIPGGTGNIVLMSHDNVFAPGGQSVYRDPVSQRPIMVYHYVPRDKLGGKSFLGISYLDFTSGWPVLVKP